MGMLAKIRRLHLRDGLSIREVSRRTGLSRNTVREWLRQEGVTEPKYAKRERPSVVAPWAGQLEGALRADAHRPVRERRTAKALFEQIQALGYRGSYPRVVVWVRRWREAQAAAPRRAAFVPLAFELGEAFQFDWSCEYVFIGGLRRRLEVAHTKLAASRAFWLTAYPSQSHEMLFDAHARAFDAFGGVPRRGIYDNMKTAVDKVGVGKARAVNARFAAMCSHYLFEPEFCNRASGWEKGIVEKNVQDQRRTIWREAAEQRWPDLARLNAWLASRCRQSWEEAAHPDWPLLTVADVLQDERAQLLPLAQRFDGYIEQPVRVSHTGLIHFQRNRYSVPTAHVNAVLSLRIYPEELVLIAEGGVEVARQPRSFERDQTRYDWRHYIDLVQTKPGALRNGAPFRVMPEPLQILQRHLLRHAGGDRVMAQVLAAVPIHGLDAVLVAAELALEAGRPSAEHVLNVLARLKEAPSGHVPAVALALTLSEEPRADVNRYDRLRGGVQ
ncbi:IS21 family transposase [Aquabacterium sp.]|uniref:IS21 family transposase n=1 Tax=Aquabacterium sp. TaxID=1872578 RepID=UPI0035B3F2DB